MNPFDSSFAARQYVQGRPFYHPLVAELIHPHLGRLPRRLQELRERCGLRKYGFARESGISREYIGKIERGSVNPTLPVTAQISFGLGMRLEEFTGRLEDEE